MTLHSLRTPGDWANRSLWSSVPFSEPDQIHCAFSWRRPRLKQWTVASIIVDYADNWIARLTNLERLTGVSCTAEMRTAHLRYSSQSTLRVQTPSSCVSGVHVVMWLQWNPVTKEWMRHSSNWSSNSFRARTFRRASKPRTELPSFLFLPLTVFITESCCVGYNAPRLCLFLQHKL